MILLCLPIDLCETVIFVTSDHHFSHYKILEYQAHTRPFSSLDEMHNFYIEMWNDQVSSKDTVYYLGDFCFYNPAIYINKLNGRIKFIPGNHDGWIKKYRNPIFSATKHEIEILPHIYVLKIDKINKFVCCHYPMYSWPHSGYGVIHFHGHTHQSINYNEKAIHVGIDEHNRLLNVQEFVK